MLLQNLTLQAVNQMLKPVLNYNNVSLSTYRIPLSYEAGLNQMLKSYMSEEFINQNFSINSVPLIEKLPITPKRTNLSYNITIINASSIPTYVVNFSNGLKLYYVNNPA